MRSVIPDVYIFEGLRISNVYLLDTDGELTLIDSGLNGDVEKIVLQIRKAGFKLNMLKNIILTHTHGDHIGGAPQLARISGAKIYAHRDEVAYIEQRSILPTNSLVQQMLNWLSDRIVFRQSMVGVDKALSEGDELDILGGLRAIHSPGHTPGCLSLYQPDREILFCGDVLFNAHPITRKPGLQLPLRMVSVDMDQVRQSVKRISNMHIETLCCGHGNPILENANEQIQALLP